MLVAVANLAKVTESDESVYSETSKTNSDSYNSDEYYENDISQDLEAAIDTQNQNNDQCIQGSRSSSRCYPDSYIYVGIQGYNKTNTYKLLLVSCFHILQAYTILS